MQGTLTEEEGVSKVDFHIKIGRFVEKKNMVSVCKSNRSELVSTRGLYYKTFYGRNLRISVIT